MTAPKKRAIGDILRDARVALRFTQTDFACELGVSRRTLSRWEWGETTPTPIDVEQFVTRCHRFNLIVAQRAARELGMPVPAGPSSAALDDVFEIAATSVGGSPMAMRVAVELLVARWRELGATLDDVASWLAS